MQHLEAPIVNLHMIQHNQIPYKGAGVFLYGDCGRHLIASEISERQCRWKRRWHCSGN
ncbi:MAG: hypothetical protein ACLT0Y_06435 [Christensenellales bacterium]